MSLRRGFSNNFPMQSFLIKTLNLFCDPALTWFYKKKNTCTLRHIGPLDYCSCEYFSKWFFFFVKLWSPNIGNALLGSWCKHIWINIQNCIITYQFYKLYNWGSWEDCGTNLVPEITIPFTLDYFMWSFA